MGWGPRGAMNSAYILCSILLMASALISILTKAPKDVPSGDSWMDRVGENFAMARRQPVDVYLGARHI